MKKNISTNNINLGCFYKNKFAPKSRRRRISVVSVCGYSLVLVFTLVFIYFYSSPISLGKEEEDESIEFQGSFENTTSTRFMDMNLLGNQSTTTTTFDNHEDQECDIFDGQWVLSGEDHMKPYYPPGSCPFVETKFNCHLHKRPDDGYLKWQWQPNGCNISRLNASDFLERLRGKRMLFVGDSMNRNMGESLVCILRNNVMNKSSVYEIPRKEFKEARVFRFEDYKFSLELLHAPFLVGISSYENATKRNLGKKHKNDAMNNEKMETLRLDMMDQNVVSSSSGADIIVFNSWRWWKDGKFPKGGNYFHEGNHVYAKLDLLKAYEKALTTWGKWIDRNIDSKKTKVVFRGYSVSHFRGGKWNTGGKCSRAKEPIFDQLTHIETYPWKAKILENILQQMKTRVLYLNISKLTYYRADGHPSIYQKEYKRMEEEQNSTQDCVHWCLPGIPDIWNELLYTSLLKGW